jgi:hypothetical protein
LLSDLLERSPILDSNHNKKNVFEFAVRVMMHCQAFCQPEMLYLKIDNFFSETLMKQVSLQDKEIIENLS